MSLSDKIISRLGGLLLIADHLCIGLYVVRHPQKRSGSKPLYRLQRQSGMSRVLKTLFWSSRIISEENIERPHLLRLFALRLPPVQLIPTDANCLSAHELRRCSFDEVRMFFTGGIWLPTIGRNQTILVAVAIMGRKHVNPALKAFFALADVLGELMPEVELPSAVSGALKRHKTAHGLGNGG